MEKAPQKRNNSIDIFRYVCALLVTFVHIVGYTRGTKLSWLSWLTCEVLARITVLYFFAIAGYYYIRSLESGKRIFLKYFSRIVATYIFWSAIYFLLSYFRGSRDLIVFLKEAPKQFFVLGSYFHLWFFPALLFSVVATTALYKLRLSRIMVPLSLLLFAIGCLGSREFAIGERIPGISRLIQLSSFRTILRMLMMSFPFFVMGGLVGKTRSRWESASNRLLAALTFGFLLVYTLEAYITRKLGVAKTPHLAFFMYPFVFFLLHLLINNPLPNRGGLGNDFRGMANFTYYAHPLLDEYIFSPLLMSMGLAQSAPHLSRALVFLLVVLLCAAIGRGIVRADKKPLNRLIR